MQLKLLHQGEEIATLACDETKVWIVKSHQAFKKSIEDRIRRGIDFPKEIAASEFNFKPGTTTAEEQLLKISNLYKWMYRMEVLPCDLQK